MDEIQRRQLYAEQAASIMDVSTRTVTLEELKERYLFGGGVDIVLVAIADKSNDPEVLYELAKHSGKGKAGKFLAKVIANNRHTPGVALDILARENSDLHETNMDILGNVTGNRNTWNSTLEFLVANCPEVRKDMRGASFSWVGDNARRKLEARKERPRRYA